MRLSDIMSAMRLEHFAEIGLVIFLAVFLAICVQVFRRDNRAKWEAASRIPLEVEPVIPTPAQERRQP